MKSTIFNLAIQDPKICFFGDKNKILIYNINDDDWNILKLD